MTSVRRLRKSAPQRAGRRLRRIAVAALLAASCPGLASAACAPGDTGPCDDGRACTTEDRCVSGECVGRTPAVPAACDWAVVGGNASEDARERAGYRSVIGGSICGQALRIDSGATIGGDVVTTASSGSGIRFGRGASVNGDVVTGDAALVDDCREAIDSVKPTITTLDSVAFRSTADEGNVSIPSHADYTLVATKKLNVLDFSSLVAGDWSTITLDGNSIPDVTFVLRVNRKLYLHFHSMLLLAGGAVPERVILYGREECRIGQAVQGAGTVFCPYDSLTVDRETTWTGAMVGGGDRIELRHDVELTHVPSGIPIP